MFPTKDLGKEHINAKLKRAKNKLSPVFSLPDIILPDSEVIEQASSDATGQFLASLIEKGEVVADLTAGLGVNTYYLSRKAKHIVGIEIVPERARILSHNLKISGVENAEIITDDCVHWLENSTMIFNTVFIDPSRRMGNGNKVLRFEDCSPNIKSIISLLQGRCKRILVKISPLFDIKKAFDFHPGVGKIYIVETDKEVKELIMDITLDSEVNFDEKLLICVSIMKNIIKDEIKFSFETASNLNNVRYLFGSKNIEPDAYIYEPGPAIMKAAPWGTIAEKFPTLLKFSNNTHLFYSKDLIEDFPGRIFKVVRKMRSSDLKKLKGQNYNIISRNHPAKATEIEERYKLKASEESYIIACTVGHDKTIIETNKRISSI